MNKLFLIISLLLIFGCTNQQPPLNQQPPFHQLPPPQQRPPNAVTVLFTNSTYQALDKYPDSGSFSTGQSADLVLNWFGFNNSGGPSFFNHPMGVASDGTHFVLADTRNNRLLIWNEPPLSNEPPDLVIGQKNFYANEPGTANDKLRWPVGVAASNGKLIVADTYNNRVLIWNEFPTTNGEPADLVLGQDDFLSTKESVKPDTLSWPWAVWTDGTKLIVTNTHSGSVMIWNSFPTINNQAPDIILTNDDFGTPRNIESDGSTYLVIGDHNARQTGRGGNFVWNSFPSSNIDYNAYIGGEVLWCSEVIDDDLIGTANYRLVSVNNFTSLNGDFNVIDSSTQISDYLFTSGDGSGMVRVGNVSYFSLYNGGRVIGYLNNNFNREPDFVIGADTNANPATDINYFFDNPKVLIYNDSLVAFSGFNKKISLWRNIPNENGAVPDVIFSLQFEPLSGVVYDDKLFVIGRGGFLVWDWNTFIQGGMPLANFNDEWAGLDISEGNGVAVDDHYFYATINGKLYMWSQPFNWTKAPLKRISFDFDVGKLSSNGKWLTATTMGSVNSVVLLNISTLLDASPKMIKLLDSTNIRFNLPGDVFLNNNSLFVADTNNHRVLIWSSIPSSGTDLPDIVIGQQSFTNNPLPKYTQDGLFMPSSVWFENNQLWVGEYKFSGRILRFSGTHD